MTTPVPETRNSLILRLTDHGDADAWEQFVAVYEPLVYRLARAKGFQDADAREVVQEVLLAVSRAIHRWQPNAELGRFRDWLFRIARNLIVNFMTRRRHQSIAGGDRQITDLLDKEIDPSSDESAVFDLEYRREVFRWAAERVRQQVQEPTWQAFWWTSVELRSISDVASELNLSVGAVHIARSRVRNRLRAQVRNWADEDGQ